MVEMLLVHQLVEMVELEPTTSVFSKVKSMYYYAGGGGGGRSIRFTGTLGSGGSGGGGAGASTWLQCNAGLQEQLIWWWWWWSGKQWW